MSQELLRIVDNIARDKNIDRESIFADLEEAMISAARKHFGDPEGDIVVNRYTSARSDSGPDGEAGYDPEDSCRRAGQHLQRVCSAPG